MASSNRSQAISEVIDDDPLTLRYLDHWRRQGTTSSNSMFAVRSAHPNAFGTSQTRKPLGEI